MAVLWIKIREGAIARVVYHMFHTACFTPHHYDPSDSLSVSILTVDIYMSFSHKCTLTDSPDCAKRPSHHILSGFQEELFVAVRLLRRLQPQPRRSHHGC